MKIGNLTFNKGIFLAPMAGYTDVGFRAVCEKCGAELCFTEMVSAKGFFYGSEKTEEMMAFENAKYRAIQIFGSDAEIMGQICEKLSKKCDLIDINMGCPAPKIYKNGEGSALLNDFTKAEKIIRECVRCSSVPVTVKFRLGVKSDNFVGVEFAKMCEISGASAIAIHGRFTEQYYAGNVDYEKISQIVKAVSIPVIGSGDIVDKASYKIMLETGVSAVMIGRGAVGNPQIFTELTEGTCGMTKWQALEKHVEILKKYYDEDYIVRYMRKHFVAYLSSRKNCTSIKREVVLSTNLDEAMRLCKNALTD